MDLFVVAFGLAGSATILMAHGEKIEQELTREKIDNLKDLAIDPPENPKGLWVWEGTVECENDVIGFKTDHWRRLCDEEIQGILKK